MCLRRRRRFRMTLLRFDRPCFTRSGTSVSPGWSLSQRSYSSSLLRFFRSFGSSSKILRKYPCTLCPSLFDFLAMLCSPGCEGSSKLGDIQVARLPYGRERPLPNDKSFIEMLAAERRTLWYHEYDEPKPLRIMPAYETNRYAQGLAVPAVPIVQGQRSLREVSAAAGCALRWSRAQ